MKYTSFLSVSILGAFALSLSLSACSKKPKQEARAEPKAPVFQEPKAVTMAPTPQETKVRIQDLLAEAFKPVYFPYDQATLPETAKDLLAKAAELMKQAPGVTVQIDGHADERGTDEYNLALGEKRANTVKAYLTNYGINPSRLKTISYGEEKPNAIGHEETDWAQNRRDEFKVTLSPDAE
ncbi:MAG: peptidoglycan-associated lipoprotein Pal [Fibrobacteria bacterium]